MTKKLDPNKLLAPARRDFKKVGNDTGVTNIDSIVKQIHAPADEKEKSEATKRTTIDFPKSIHKQICQRVLDKELTMKDYFLGLVKKDLNIE